MNSLDILSQVHSRIETHRPIFQERYPTREVELEVLSHFGRVTMQLLIEKGNLQAETVREFTLNHIKQIDRDLKSELVPDRDNKEMQASIQLGVEQIGEEFPDLLYAALQVEWDKVDQEWNKKNS